MNIETLFQKAINHRHDHGCSAPPYEEAGKLIEYVQKYQPSNILEIGTGIGYTAAVMSLTAPSAHITTVEKDPEHARIAEQYLKDAQASTKNINIVVEPAEQFLQTLKNNFDLIFFDGYQIHYELLPQYERLLNSGGILFLANNHLKSRTSDQFFNELFNYSVWKILEQFSDTTVAQKI